MIPIALFKKFLSSPPVIFILTVPRQYFLFFFCLVFAMPLCASVNMCLVVTCWERVDLLALVCDACEFVTFPLVSLVRCGT